MAITQPEEFQRKLITELARRVINDSGMMDANRVSISTMKKYDTMTTLVGMRHQDFSATSRYEISDEMLQSVKNAELRDVCLQVVYSLYDGLLEELTKPENKL